MSPTKLAAIIGVVVAATLSACTSGDGTDRASLVKDLEYHGGLSTKESECIVDRLVTKFGATSTRAIIDASAGKPNPEKLAQLPPEQREAVGQNMEPCGVKS